jgi:hypothetical protein
VNFDVEVNGRPWKVAVEAGEQPTQVTVGAKGRKRVVDASWVDADTLSLIDGSIAREVRVSGRAEGVLSVTFGGWTFEAVVASGSRLQASGSRPQSEVRSATPVAQGSTTVAQAFSHAGAPTGVSGGPPWCAPMPGRVASGAAIG